MWHSASEQWQSPAPSYNTALALLLCTQQFAALQPEPFSFSKLISSTQDPTSSCLARGAMERQ